MTGILSLFINNIFFYTQLTSNSIGSGLFLNDLNFFYFELYFLFAVSILLIFFVMLSNKKIASSKYLNVSGIFLNISFFVILVLLFLLNSSCQDSYYLFSGFYFNDDSAVFFKNLLLISFLLFLFSVKNYTLKLKNYDFEFILILLISLFSSLLLLNSGDLISLFFIIELQSLSFYILVASKQTSSFSTESGLKYFILGCFSSGIILFGISLIYGFTGLLSYNDLSLFVSSFLFTESTLNFYLYFPFTGLVAGLTLLTIGFLFKLGSVPFHMWMPDVYEGAPMIITFYLSTIPKMALLFVMFKLYYGVFFPLFVFYQNLFVISALLSIILGSIAAIYQVKLKRLLTYSMITNTGYILLSFSFGDISGIYITVFYLVSYILIMVGLFFCFICLRSRSTNFLIKRINILANLVEINPYLAFSIFILLFSIAGIPPLLGFYSKFFLFLFSVKFKMYWLALLFVVFSVVSVFYYIRLVKLMYFNRLSGWVFLHEIPFSNAFIIGLITLLNCVFFINPNLVFKFIYNFSFVIYL
jgi:NADH-quinone oxidoreductase subunit N